MTESLGPQFLFHGTTRDIEGQILPAKVHGGHSYWGETGHTRSEPSNEYAWAHPNEQVAWQAALDRVESHYVEGEEKGPRARVYAVHPNENQSPGMDKSMAGEIKSTHFDIAHPVDTMPGRQGTFPSINWNEYTGKGQYLPGDEDTNHPSHLSVQFGHRLGVHEQEHVVQEHMQRAAHEEGMNRYMDRIDSRNVSRYNHEASKDDPLPGMPSWRRRF